MTRIERQANQDAGNRAYAAKRLLSSQTIFDITRQLATNQAGWTPETVAARQSAMAKQATAIGRIAQLR